jgi:diguanylate cyclase (GGDEF)-like protein
LSSVLFTGNKRYFIVFIEILILALFLYFDPTVPYEFDIVQQYANSKLVYSINQILSLLSVIIVVMLIIGGYLREHKRAIDLVKDLEQKNKELIDAKNRAEYEASHDALTRITNRKFFLERLNQIQSLSEREETCFTLMFLDLDGFKNVNDSLGHNIGDKLLVELCKRVKKTIRDSDTFSRMGGDEFAIILEKCSNKQIEQIANRIVKAIAKPFKFENNTANISVSVGISRFSTSNKNVSELLKQADSAMYEVKKEGKNGYRFAENKISAIT